ncbi:MAG TPA: nuclear transport factor 2 family protein [Acidimicrobiales bacterium]|nr:nuclear transport factor 2 family protein [Acidimicrobiales bacterium]
MSVPAGSSELRAEVDRYGPVAYLVTVSPETGRPHVVSVTVTWAGDALVSGAGSRTRANVGAGDDVSLLWPPMPGEAFSLIVDGRARIVDGAEGPLVSVHPAGAVRHRLAGAERDGPSCIPVTVDVTSQEVAVGPVDHPNAATVRRFIDAWFDGDFATWTSLAADDIVIHMRRKPAIEGSYHGREGVNLFFERFAAVHIDGFEMEVEDVVADDRYAMAILRTEYHRGDEYLPLRNACAYRLDSDGRIAEAWNVSDSQDPERDFFTLPVITTSGAVEGPTP